MTTVGGEDQAASATLKSVLVLYGMNGKIFPIDVR
jgi:hypothetical protein